MRAHLQGGVLRGSVDDMQRGDEAIMRNGGKVRFSFYCALHFRHLTEWQIEGDGFIIFTFSKARVRNDTTISMRDDAGGDLHHK